MKNSNYDIFEIKNYLEGKVCCSRVQNALQRCWIYVFITNSFSVQI